MEDLKHRMKQANSLLKPYAVPHGQGLGREYPETPDATRFPFQRDRDRILHTQSFRRLKGKTQVFVSVHGDHYRTRITHTLEVAQISRDIARTLGLNEDLAEAIALAHDLGHTPFGHAGEDAMRECMEKFGKTFEHNQQSLRIVTLLEERTKNYPGLNLSGEVLEGLMKHPTSSASGGLRGASQPFSLEAQIVNLADEIAYTAHDTDDGLRAALFSSSDIRRTSLGKMASDRARSNGTEIRGALVDLLVTDLYKETSSRIRRDRIRALRDVYAASHPAVSFSAPMQKNLQEHREFLWDTLYKSPAVLRQANRGKEILRELFQSFLKRPPMKVKALREKTKGALEDAVKDYIAGMTDGYAVERYQGLRG